MLAATEEDIKFEFTVDKVIDTNVCFQMFKSISDHWF